MSEPGIKDDQVVTKDFLAAQSANLELRLTQQMMAMERSLRNSIDTTRNLIFGTYALMIAAVFINHFWK
jgi:hypothetical protein